MLIFHFLVSQLNKLYFLLLNCKLHLISRGVVCTKMVSGLQYHRSKKFSDCFTLRLALSCRTLSFDKCYELLHTKLVVPKCLDLALSEAYLNRLELLRKKLTDDFVCLPNVLLLKLPLYLLKFFFQSCSEHFNVLAKHFWVEMSKCCLLRNLEALKDCFIITGKFYVFIETLLENLYGLFCGFLTLVLAYVSPGTFNIWNCSSVDWIDVLLRQIHNNTTSE